MPITVSAVLIVLFYHSAGAFAIVYTNSVTSQAISGAMTMAGR